jgi:hypothetical protein
MRFSSENLRLEESEELEEEMDFTSSACQIDLSFMGDCAEMEGEERSPDISLELTFAASLEAGGE